MMGLFCSINPGKSPDPIAALKRPAAFALRQTPGRWCAKATRKFALGQEIGCAAAAPCPDNRERCAAVDGQ
jgi:hypothetical protein